MQRKKFLALMLTAALVGQPGAPVSIMAAETDESSDFGSFGSEASDTAEKKLPVITEDLSEETITYDLNEKAEPLKVQTEESGKLKYLWLKSDDNENFYKIGKSDSQERQKKNRPGNSRGKTASRSMKIHRSIHRLQIQPEPSTTKSGSGIQKKQTKTLT